jgi:NAD(P)-dependent dehydrogenase (short-subunit alcohol dehydrogenase family)
MTDEARVALVTGASRGIGRACAIALARRGLRVAVHYHRAHAAAIECAAALDGAAGPHPVFQGDLTQPEEARSLVDAVTRDCGRLDVVVNNAGIYELHALNEVSWDDWQSAWRHTLDANLLGPAHVTYWAARHMTANGGGRIVAISSRGAFRGEPEAPAYAASKAGLNAMTLSLARALAPRGVLLYVVSPGWVATDMATEHLAGPEGDAIRAQSPLGRVARPEEVAATVAFLACDDTEYMTGSIVDLYGASYLRT